MTRDDAKKILGESATEEQVTNLLNNFHNSDAEKEKNAKIAELESKLNKYSDYDVIKKQLDDINISKMTEQEKIEADKKAATEALKNAQIIYNTAKVKEILAGETIDENLMKNLVSSDEMVSIANATALKQTLTALKDSVAKQTRESMANVDLKPSISNVSQNDEVMTFAKFSKLSAVEQENFINEHPEEFEKL